MTMTIPPNELPPIRPAPVLASLASRAALAAEERPDADAGPEPFDWRRAWAAVRRWRWLVAGITVGGALLGVIASRIVRPSYRAQATIWIDARDRQANGPVPFQPGRLLDPEAWLDLVRSYTVLDDVAREEHLFVQAPARTPASFLASFQVTDSFRPGPYRLTADADGST